MWNLSGQPPQRIETRVATTMPTALRRPVPSEWAQANKPGHVVDCFIEGPCFDAAGNLYITDIPHGRIFRLDSTLDWMEVANTGGWPNGLALHSDGSIWIADYRKGLLRLEPESGRIETVLGHRNSESFKGLNDLVFDNLGRVYFTDQGQTGLHDPSGRVYRFDESSGRVDLLLTNAPSPNGIALGDGGKTLFVAMTRANQVWRAPLLPDGSISKMGAFQTFFGTSGPDGLCWSAAGELVVAHASLGAAFALSARGEVSRLLLSPSGPTVTNVALKPGGSEIWMTESSSGTVLVTP